MKRPHRRRGGGDMVDDPMTGKRKATLADVGIAGVKPGNDTAKVIGKAVGSQIGSEVAKTAARMKGKKKTDARNPDGTTGPAPGGDQHTASQASIDRAKASLKPPRKKK